MREPEHTSVRVRACGRGRGGALQTSLPFEEKSHHEDAKGQGEGEIEVFSLREGGFLRVFQVRPGDIVRQPKSLVPEPG